MLESVPSVVLDICRTLNQAGHQAWLVGGAVRDLIMGRPAHDWDIATDARPEAVVSLFPKVIETGIKHGTVTVLIDQEGFEVTTFRGESGFSDGRRPDEVHFLNSIEEDLARRDFTMNAIALNLISGAFCDPFKGQEDIAQGIIRAVGDPLQRFLEDGLRPLRAVRFAATLGFKIEDRTLGAIKPTLDIFRKVAIERVQAEWVKILSAPDPSMAFRIMADTGLLGATAPEFLPMIGCKQNRYHAFDVWEHTLSVVDAVPVSAGPVLRLAALFHDIGKPASRSVNPKTGDFTFYEHEVIGAEIAKASLVRMKFSNDIKELVCHLVRHHYIRFQSDWSSAAIRRWVRKVGLEHVPALCTLARADIAGKGPSQVKLDPAIIADLEARISNLKVSEVLPTSTKVLKIDGNDVIHQLNIRSGREVGRVLNALLEAVTDNPELNTRETLLEMIRTV